MPGVWGDMFTFWSGAHACIGWRFAVLECVPHVPLAPFR
jgi:cytochrome P450